ncbi:uncharacterized protein LOC143569075 [Bidens hawaiensis]|uniref:uncharacterized protein LOC143569075 n=1 Tax=Bidens hawaiensis TaxID=980011 RepID=UPI00404A2587
MEVPSKTQGKTPIIEPQVEKRLVEIRPPHIIDLSHVPYPARLKHQEYIREYRYFLDMFRQLKINLPFIKALQHMPNYAKFLKDLLKRKDQLGEVSSIPLSGDCSMVVLNRVQEKLSDPGVFTIPCMFGSDMMNQALLELGELTLTRMSLSLEDRLVKYSRGIIENFLVKVDKFVFPVDFVDGRITLRVGDENVPYDVAKSMKHPSFDTCHDYICGADLVGMDVDEELKEECFLLGGDYGGYFHTPIAPKDQEKTTFTCPYGTFAYRHMSFGLCVQFLDVSVPILVSPDWNLTFELMCDASDYAVGAKDAKPRLIRWILLLSEFDIEIKDKKGAENLAEDHLSRLEDPKREEIREEEIGDRFSHELIDFFAVEKQGDDYTTKEEVLLGCYSAARKRYFQIHKLEELRDAPYSRSLDIKEKTKVWHGRRLKGGKLRSKWTGPYLVKEFFTYGVVELENPDNGMSWKVNGYCLKHYLGGPEDSTKVEETPLHPSN